MQFMPVDWNGFLIQFEAMTFCCIASVIGILIYTIRKKGRQGSEQSER